MENGCLVSVIIPVFNVKPYLIEALDSVINQTYTNLEIIIIDDGSSDGSDEICNKYARIDKRVIVIHQENKGLSSARNAGLDMMNGEAVVFLDSDDKLHPEFIRTMLAVMIREVSEVVLCKYTVQNMTDRLIRHKKEEAYPILEEGLYKRECALRALADGRINLSVWNKIYKRELWDNLRFRDGYVYEDIESTYRVFDSCNQIYVLDQPYYLHRIRPESITATYSYRNINDWVFALTQFEAFIQANIPEVFSQTQLKKIRESQFHVMITGFVRLSAGTATERRQYSKQLRRQVIYLGKELDIREGGFRTEINYWMIRFCPGLLRSGYFLYRFARKILITIS